MAFATEASEWLAQVHAAFREAEKGASPERARNLCAAMQRDLTTLKGSAGTVNLPSIEELAWRLVPLLQDLQAGPPKASPVHYLLVRQGLEVLESGIQLLALAEKKSTIVEEIETSARQQVSRIQAGVRQGGDSADVAKRAAPPGLSLIEAVNLRKVYHEGSIDVIAVDGVSLALRPGEMVAVLGPSGSGKTTLLSMMGFLLVPTAGTIRLLGQPVDTKRESLLPALRRQHIGFIFQNANLLRALTALENVSIALHLKGTTGTAARHEAETLLERVGLKHRKHFMPRDLSGGEKQRVAVARALAGAPSLILADEPTANLDSKSGQAVVELMREIATEGRRAVALVTHDTRNLRFVDRLVQLEDGRLVG
jgi:putative ABC transport system ATP-binding protein